MPQAMGDGVGPPPKPPKYVTPSTRRERRLRKEGRPCLYAAQEAYGRRQRRKYGYKKRADESEGQAWRRYSTARARARAGRTPVGHAQSVAGRGLGRPVPAAAAPRGVAGAQSVASRVLGGPLAPAPAPTIGSAGPPTYGEGADFSGVPGYGPGPLPPGTSTNPNVPAYGAGADFSGLPGYGTGAPTPTGGIDPELLRL